MTIEVDVEHRLGGFRLAARFKSEGRVTAFFGPSGSGKTSLVNVIAGLIRPDRGRVAIQGDTLTDTERGRFVPKYRRRVGYVFQEGRLFPHLSVRRNLLYGRWFTAKGARYGSLDQVVELLGIGDLLDRYPDRLSGGEKQRVAIGRALLASPRVLLLDEPLAALDEERKAEILPYIERLSAETRIPIVYVSHSVAEVSRLATTVVALSAGAVVAVGPPVEVLNRPDVLTDQRELGTLIEAEIAGQDQEFGLTTLHCRAGDLHVARLDLPIGMMTRIRIRPQDVLIATAPPAGLSALNVVRGTVRELGAASGATIEVILDCGGQELRALLTRRSAAALSLAAGVPVYAIIKTVALDPGALGRFVKDDAARWEEREAHSVGL